MIAAFPTQQAPMITVQSWAEFEVAADTVWRLVRAFDATARWNHSVR